MHQLGLVHQDIKIENIIFSIKHNKCKLCDFNTAFYIK